MKTSHSIALALTLIVSSNNTFLQAQSQEKVYSALMISFAKGILWPKAMEQQDFIIGVLEYPPLVAELLTSANNTKINSRQMRIREFTHVSDVEKCHILFIPAYKARQLTAVLEKIGSTPTLVITNKNDLVKKGSDINFVLIGGKLRYEINTQSIEKRGMKISVNVKSLGIAVE
jgi:hypothetical protein